MAEKPNKSNALKDYVEVNVRIEKFYEKYPNGRIHTSLLSWENGVVVMKAEIYRDFSDSVPSATGHAYEKEGSSFINKTSALENCETSAVGRGLAILGFEIKKSIASKEEVEKAKLSQDQHESPISQEQVGILKTTVLEYAMMYGKTDVEVYEVLGISDVTFLSQYEANEIIAKVTNWITTAKKETE